LAWIYWFGVVQVDDDLLVRREQMANVV
jgi:hypothetical protein